MITDNEVKSIAEKILSAQAGIDAGRVTYLRILVTAAQEDLPKGSDARVQVARVGTVHDRFYALVMAAAEAHVPKGTKGRAVELHRRVNFARTAASALRNHARAGGDIATLKADSVTKNSLKRRPPPTPRPLSAKRALKRAEDQSKALMASLMALGEADKRSAVDEIQIIIGQLSHQLVELGAEPGARRARGRGHHIPPSTTQVIRATARAS